MDEDERIDRQLVLDANAVAGLLADIFGSEMTESMSECTHCGNVGAVGTLVAYTRGPGTVLRCSVCTEVVMRVAITPRGTVVDARGAARMMVRRPA